MTKPKRITALDATDLMTMKNKDVNRIVPLAKTRAIKLCAMGLAKSEDGGYTITDEGERALMHWAGML